MQGTAMKGTREQLELVAALLGEQTTLSLATTGEDGEAWVAPLFYIANILGEGPSLYWLSSQSSLHSLNLLRTPRAAATVYRNAGNSKEIRGVQMRGLVVGGVQTVDIVHSKEIRGVQMRGPVSRVIEPERRRALIKTYCERFKLGTIFRLAISQSALYAFQPDFFRYIDNSKSFGYKFELRRGPEGWSSTRPAG
jgi:uncharacterized protein YhbP (UPF0306 family)